MPEVEADPVEGVRPGLHAPDVDGDALGETFLLLGDPEFLRQREGYVELGAEDVGGWGFVVFGGDCGDGASVVFSEVISVGHAWSI